jgi:pimeloyl-ACP methyl ester carboxylesterase
MKSFLFSCLLLCGGTPIFAQEITGSWQGLIKAGATNLHFVLNLTKNGDTYSASFDSPDQKVFGIAASKTIINTDSVITEMSVMRASYKGKWNGRDEIAGVFSQGAFSTELNLTRLSESEKIYPPAAKPQTPRPPFPYSSENIEYENTDHSLHYGATLTKPNGAGKFPAVIIISGSGSQDRDGTIGTHKPYAVLADYLTRNGIAVLRVDDRGTGKSNIGNDIDKVTSAEFAKDVETGIAYLQSRSDIDIKNIGMIGHSEGGMIAPMVAARRNDIAFIVLLAGPGIPCEKIWDYQMERSFIKSGLNEKEMQKAQQLIRDVFATLKHATDYDTITTNMHSVYLNWKKNVSDSMQARLLTVSNDEAFIQWATLMKKAHALYWTNYFLNYQPAVNLQRVKCPVLALNGESDIQVRCKENLAGIEMALQKGKNKNYKVVAMPGLNHLFQSCKSPLDDYEKLEETFSPTALQVISEWIHAQVK